MEKNFIKILFIINFFVLGTTGHSYPKILTIYCSGGWDPAMVFDSKIGVTEVAEEPGITLRTSSSGIQHVHHSDRSSVKQFFDTFGSYTAIINGIFIGGMSKTSMEEKALTFIPPDKAMLADWLSVYAAQTNPFAILPHITLNAPYIPGEYGSNSIYLDDKAIASYLDTSESFSSTREKALVNMHKTSYNRFFTGITTSGIDGNKAKNISSHALREQNVKTVITQADAALGGTPDYSDFATNGKLAVELMALGVTQAVTLGSGKPDQWNTTASHFSTSSTHFQNLFTGINTILTYANSKGIISDLIVLVISDGGRSPKLNSEGGKGMWPYTSWLLFGSNVNGGKTFGTTDNVLRGSVIDPVFGVTNGQNMVTITPAHIFSSIFDANGLPYKLLFPNNVPLSFLFRRSKT